MTTVARPRKDPMRPKPSTFELVTKQPLRILTKFGGHELTEKLGLRKPASKALHESSKLAAKAITSMGSKPKAKTTEPAARLNKTAEPNRFDLRPSEDQEMLKQSVRRFAEDILRPVAQKADKAATTPEDVLARAPELALAGLAVPEAFGGIAETSSIVTNVMIIEELARGDMGLALAILAPMGVVNALVDWGTREQQEEWLPKFTGEKFVPAALAILESRPLFDANKPRTGAVRSKRGGWTLHGEKNLVPLAESAEVFLIAAEVKGAGPKLFIVEKGTPGLTVTAEPAMGLRAAGLGRVRLEGVNVPAEALLGGEEGALRNFDFDVVVNRARIAWAAMAVGTSQAMLDHVIPYVNERKAFGDPISNRQAVAFMVADLAIEIEAMRLMLLRAASLADRGQDVTRYTSMLRTHVAAKGMKVGTDGLQLLGGHGFVKDHPVERWYRDLRAIGVMEGALLA